MRVGRALALVLVAGCGTGVFSANGRDGGSDALPTSCTTSSDCPSGTQCLFPIGGGCLASRECIALSPGQCKSEQVCQCNAVTATACGGGQLPVAHLGPCHEPDAGPSCSVACEQCDVSGYTPPIMAPPEQANACTSAELTAFVAACLGSTASATSCNGWRQQDGGACSACLAFSAPIDATWGPLYCPGNEGCIENEGGCVDLVLGTIAQERQHGGPGSCGDAITAASGCEEAACSSCATPTDLAACTQSADMNECASYASAQSSTTGPCAALALAAPDADVSTCFPQSDADLVSFVNVFCGTGP